MRPIDQNTKSIMEDCKRRARDEGLSFPDESLEFIITNREMNNIEPKIMIPTLYDYWVDDTSVIKQNKVYDVMPSNAFETVVNTRPPVSYYNIGNPDWLNVMIFYHVLGHMDFFNNNRNFKNTWDYDFMSKARAQSRKIDGLRSEHGRWVDYAIEFSRSVDNLIDPFAEADTYESEFSPEIDFYFDIFLQDIKGISSNKMVKEVERYNSMTDDGDDSRFLADIRSRHKDFDKKYELHLRRSEEKPKDLMEFIKQNSDFLEKEDNEWMKSIMDIVRDTSLYFSPQMKTKIMNEGWASFWHKRLFMKDPHIQGHEIDFANLDAKVTSHKKGGINPYALGVDLFKHIKDMGDLGRYSEDYKAMKDQIGREEFDLDTGKGLEQIFEVRKNHNDSSFIRQFIDQDFMRRTGLYVLGSRVNIEKGTREYYVKSKRAEDYRDMVRKTLYHPPSISYSTEDMSDFYEGPGFENVLYLNHSFEGKQLHQPYIPNTLLGIEYLWGNPVILETDVIDEDESLQKYVSVMEEQNLSPGEIPEGFEPVYKRMVFGMKDREFYQEEKEDVELLFD